MWGRLNPHLGWKWRDDRGRSRSYLLYNISLNAGMISGTVQHSGVLATRPIADFDRMSLDGFEWLPSKDLLPLVPKELDHYGLRKTVVSVQIRYRLGLEMVL